MSLFNSMAIVAQTTFKNVANLNLESMRMYTPSCQIDGNEKEEEEDFIVVSPSYSEIINGNQILVVVKAKASLVKSAGVNLKHLLRTLLGLTLVESVFAVFVLCIQVG